MHGINFYNLCKLYLISTYFVILSTDRRKFVIEIRVISHCYSWKSGGLAEETHIIFNYHSISTRYANSKPYSSAGS
jgi:hypothetical protein